MARDFWVTTDGENAWQIRTDRTGNGGLPDGTVIRGRRLDIWGRSIEARGRWLELEILGRAKLFPGCTPSYRVKVVSDTGAEALGSPAKQSRMF